LLSHKFLIKLYDKGRMITQNSIDLDVRILTNMDEVADIWAKLLSFSPCSIYQTPEFLNSWLKTTQNIEPLYIVFEKNKNPIVLLPLCVRRVGLVKIAEFLGGKHSNFNLPIFDPIIFSLGLGALQEALIRAGKLAIIDVFNFTNQPVSWQGLINPIAELGGQDSPSFGYSLELKKDTEALFSELLSKEARKKIRQKESGVAKLGGIQFIEASNVEQREDMFNAYFSQKAESFQKKGIHDPFADPAIQRWLMGLDNLRLFGLMLNDKYIAIWGCGVQGSIASGMFTSFDATSEAVKSSPGEVLLIWLLRKLCAEGYNRIDYGVGEARYKTTWSDKTIKLLDSHIGVSPIGKIAAFVMFMKGTVKREIKHSPALMKLVQQVRVWRG
jgi:CelD/BcsL family acetyltransferase involved in cellulose biosynthesis